jgi:ribosomal protein L10
MDDIREKWREKNGAKKMARRTALFRSFPLFSALFF